MYKVYRKYKKKRFPKHFENDENVLAPRHCAPPYGQLIVKISWQVVIFGFLFAILCLTPMAWHQQAVKWRNLKVFTCTPDPMWLPWSEAWWSRCTASWFRRECLGQNSDVTAHRLPGRKQHKKGAVSTTLDLAASQIRLVGLTGGGPELLSWLENNNLKQRSSINHTQHAVWLRLIWLVLSRSDKGWTRTNKHKGW